MWSYIPQVTSAEIGFHFWNSRPKLQTNPQTILQPEVSKHKFENTLHVKRYNHKMLAKLNKVQLPWRWLSPVRWTPWRFRPFWGDLSPFHPDSHTHSPESLWQSSLDLSAPLSLCSNQGISESINFPQKWHC